MAIWYAPSDPTPREQCPCCDYVSLAERGTYLICPVCFWEDDGLDLDDLDTWSGPNHITLRQARANFLKLGACDSRILQHVLPPSERGQFRHIPRQLPDVHFAGRVQQWFKDEKSGYLMLPDGWYWHGRPFDNTYELTMIDE